MPAARGRRRVSERGEALLFFAILDLVYAYAMVSAPKPLVDLYAWAAQLMPLWVWALLWAAVGVLLTVCAFLPRRDTVAFTAAVMLKIGWGVLALLGWLSGEFDRGYLTAVIWLGAAWLVYRIAGGVPPRSRTDPEAPECSPSTSR